jgi:hypothetical protein
VAANTELTDFVRNALGRGISRPQVEEVLLSAGWGRDMVATAMGGFADVDFPVPVPTPKPYVSAREACLFLLLFGMLYVSAYNTGVLAFLAIDRLFPDAAMRAYSEYARSAARWALSSLVVAFPIFGYLSARIERSVRADPAKRRSNVRRWLMYLTVFIAASVLICDVIALVYNALGGELTTRFILKVATIAIIAGTVLGYYVSDLRLEDTKPVLEQSLIRRAIGVFSVIAIVAAAAAGARIIGSPAEERARRLDAARVDDLREISDSARIYHRRHARLPASLGELAREGGVSIRDRDSEGTPYEYEVTSAATYTLCGTFERSSSERGRSGEFWSHGSGRQCFQLDEKKE